MLTRLIVVVLLSLWEINFGAEHCGVLRSVQTRKKSNIPDDGCLACSSQALVFVVPFFQISPGYKANPCLQSEMQAGKTSPTLMSSTHLDFAL